MEGHDVMRNLLVTFSRLLYERSYVTSKNGNVSVLTDSDTVLITPASSCIGFVEPGDLVEVDRSGKVLAGGKPSLEMPFHLSIYRAREDIRAVVHAHPPFVTAFSLVGRIPADDLLPEFVVSVGSVAPVLYATPGSPELAKAVAEAAGRSNALVLDHHGAITLGSDIEQAYMRLEDLEHTARVQLLAERLGSVTPIDAGEITVLREFRGESGGP